MTAETAHVIAGLEASVVVYLAGNAAERRALCAPAAVTGGRVSPSPHGKPGMVNGWAILSSFRPDDLHKDGIGALTVRSN